MGKDRERSDRTFIALFTVLGLHGVGCLDTITFSNNGKETKKSSLN